MNDIPDHVLARLRPEKVDAFRRLCDAAVERHARVEHANGQRSRIAKIWGHGTKVLLEEGNLHKVRALQLLNKTPVTIDDFVTDHEFLGDLQEVWPKLRPDLRAMNPDVFLGEKPVFEALLGGATGTGKTTISYSTAAYQIYLLSCFTAPQVIYGLSVVTPIVFLFQSTSQQITKRVLYQPFRSLFTAMPYTKRWMDWNKYRDSDLQFSTNNIHVVPTMASPEALLGQAIAGSIVDEVNSMKLIQFSTQVAGPRGQGGEYDQAKLIYNAITRRRQRSFQTKSFSMGVLVFLSSTQYKDDFLDQRMDEVREKDIKNVVTFRRKQYEVVPQDRFSGQKFKLLVGTDEYPTKIVPDDAKRGIDYPLRGQIELVPIEYIDRFKTDPEGALRDILGIATDAITPFIAQRHKLVESILRYRQKGRKSITTKTEVFLSEGGFIQWDEAVLSTFSNAEKLKPRWVHIDLSLTKDACGIAVISFRGMEARLDTATDKVELQPIIDVEAAVRLVPSHDRPVDIAEVRRWVMQLRTYYDLNIYEVTYDGFQSAESMGVLRRSGVRSRHISVDKTTEPYEGLRQAYYEDRIDMCSSEPARLELIGLEFNKADKKIDHTPKGSKDVSDAICGAVTACRTSRLLRAQTRIIDQDGTPVKVGRQAPPANDKHLSRLRRGTLKRPAELADVDQRPVEIIRSSEIRRRE